jgi:CRISPR system Cascade subunit CasD
MSTLLLTLSGPLQSWGSSSKYDRRGTEREPTKSGVIGLLACALGMKRDEDLSQLRSLRFGVGVVREGTLLMDYQMVHTKGWWDKYERGQKLPGNEAYQTLRYYLSDAKFIAAVESEDVDFLRKLRDALNNPAWPMFLGRRSCPPAEKVFRGLVDSPLEIALAEALYPDVGRILVDASIADGGQRSQRDSPESFDPAHRRYGFRFIKDSFHQNGKESNGNDHDALAALDEEPVV